MSRRNSTSGASSAGTTSAGTNTADRFVATGNGAALADAFALNANGGMSWDATNGVIIRVAAVERFRSPVSGPTYVRTSGSNVIAFRVSNTTGSTDFAVVSGSPEGVTTASPGCSAWDITNGRFYIKRTGSGNTGWVQIDRCESGTYTPTGTVVLNLDSVTPAIARYIRVGDVVYVSGTVTIDPTAASSVTFALSLPIASNFASYLNASGQIQARSTNTGSGYGDATNDRLEFDAANNSTTAYELRYDFSYTVI